MRWTEFCGSCSASDDTRAPVTLRFEPADVADHGVEAVVEVFAANDVPSARIVVGAEEVGVLSRDAVLEFVGETDEALLDWAGAPPGSVFGSGDSGAATLPGRPVMYTASWVVLRCPLEGCPSGDVWVHAADASSPVACDVHPDVPLQEADS